MKKISMLTIILLWASIGCAAIHPCLPRVAKDIYVPYDPSQIEGFLLDALSCPPGEVAKIEAWVCHNEQVELTVRGLPANATWDGLTLTWSPVEAQKGQTFYVVFTAGEPPWRDVITLPIYCFEPMTPMIVFENNRRLP